MTQNRSGDTVPARLAARAQDHPEALALEVVGAGKMTLGEWDRRSNAVARGLAAQGVGRGDRVVLSFDSRGWIPYAIAYVGIHKAGATAVPAARGMGDGYVEWVFNASSAVGVAGDAGDARVSGWRMSVDALEKGNSTEPFDTGVEPDDDAEIIFTSGTTGVPRGVVASHASVLFTHSRGTPVRRKRLVFHALPAATLAGQGLMLQPLDSVPHQVVALAEYDSRAFVAAIEQYRPTDVVMVPALVLTLIHSGAAAELDSSSVEVVRTTGASIAPVALEKLSALFPRAAIINMYASTESWPARTRMRFDSSRPGSVGRNAGPASIRIVDQLANSVLPGTTGYVELHLEGAPQRRYLGEAEASSKVFLLGGWVRTGDMGYLDPDGFLYLVDRGADRVVSGGLNVSTIEVEAAIQEFPGVVDAAVFGVPHPVLGEYVAAAVRVRGVVRQEELTAFLERRLGPARSPKRVVVMDDFPRNALGKVIKGELAAKFADSAQRGDSEGVGHELLEWVKQCWSEALGGEPVPEGVDFLALGGTSLEAMQVAGRVRHEQGRAIRQRDLFDSVDVGDFAKRVETAGPVDKDAEEPIRRVRRTESGNGEG